MRTAYIALGSNLASPAGPPESTMAAAVSSLAPLGRILCRSSLYSTAPVGFADQPRFLNAVVALDTELQPAALLDALLSIEHKYGRIRSESISNGPRTLDLDILLFGDLQIRESGLEIPHPRLADRAFVLIPLSEIAPEIVVPGRGRTVTQLLQEFQTASEKETDAVVRIQSETWRTGACDDAAGISSAQRTSSDHDHSNR